MSRITLAWLCIATLILIGWLHPWTSHNFFVYLLTLPLAVLAAGFLLEMARDGDRHHR